MLKIFDRLRSIYYIFFKNYKLIWRNEPFPDSQKFYGTIAIYENTICCPNGWGNELPDEVVAVLKAYIKVWEERNAKN